MLTLKEKPQLIAIYFSCAALVVEFVTLLALLLGKSRLSRTLKLPVFTLEWDNKLLQCLVGQILCVDLFHVFNIWEYTSAVEEVDRCTYSAKMVVFFYVFQCFFLYLFLMVKVRTTLLQHSKFTQYLDLFLRLLTFGVIPSLMVLVFFLFNGAFIYNGAGEQICVMMASPYWIMVLVFLDLVLNAGFLLLFVLPIMQLLKADEELRKIDGAARSSGEADRRQVLMGVAKRNLVATSLCVVISLAALSAMIWEAYAQDVIGKVFGCFPCVVASISNTFLMLITTKGAWKTEEAPAGGNNELKESRGQSKPNLNISPKASQVSLAKTPSNANPSTEGEANTKTVDV